MFFFLPPPPLKKKRELKSGFQEFRKQVLALPMLNNKLQKEAVLDDLEKQDGASVNQTKVGTVLEPAAKDFLSDRVECMWTFLSVSSIFC